MGMKLKKIVKLDPRTKICGLLTRINIEDVINIVTKYANVDKDQLKKLLEKN